MVLGAAGGGDSISFGIRAVADLRGIDQTSKALTGLSKQGDQVGTGIARGSSQASRALSVVQQNADSVAQSLDRISTTGFVVGAGIFAGLGVAVAKASDLNESLSKTEVVFGDATEQVVKFADTAAEKLGISKQAALEAAATFGNLFRGMGLSESAAAGMSTAIVQLAADLASFNNLDPTQVLQDLRSGLVGEAEPLRKYGILINEAAIDTELLAQGQKKVNGQWTEGQKAQARYALILQQTGTAQGDVARTADGMANSTRIARAQIADATAMLGQVFLPVVADAAQGVGHLAGAFNALPEGMQHAVGIALAVGGGLAIVAAVGAKVIAIGITTAATWTRVAGAFGQTAIAADAAAGSMTAAGTSAQVANAKSVTLLGTLGKLARIGTIGIIVVVGGAMIADVIRNSRTQGVSEAEGLGVDIAQAIADGITAAGGETIGAAVQGGVDDAKANMSARDITLEFGLELAPGAQGAADQAIEGAFRAIPGGRLIPEDWIPDVQHANDEIKGLGVSVEELQKIAEKEGITFEQALVRQADAMGVTTPAIEEYKKAQEQAAAATQDGTDAANDQADAFQAQVEAAIDAKKQQQALNKAIQDTQNQQFLTGAAAEGLFLPFTRGADDAEAATEDFNKTLDDLQREAIDTARGVADIAPELDGLQAGFGKAGDSVVDLFRKMDDVGVLNLSPSMRQALDFASALDKVEANIADVEAAIANNQGDLAMWNARISLVTDTFGANGEQIQSWIDQLQLGQITQDQFNANIAALAGSGGFPKLDALLAQGKISHEEYTAAVEAGTHLLGRSAGALQDEEAEIVRNIIALDGYVKAHDDADGAVSGLTDSQRGFLAAMADSKVQTYLQTLQLLFYLSSIGQIPPEVVTKFIADSGQADPVIGALNDDLGLLGEGTDVPIDGDPSGYNEASQDVKDDEIPPKTVDFIPGSPVTPSVGTGAGIPMPTANVNAPSSIAFTAEDQVTPVVNDINDTLATFETDAKNVANEVANAITNGIATGFTNAQTAAQNGVSGIVSALNIGNLTYNYGFNGGFNFGIGVANGITSQWNSVFNAAFNVGYAAYLGTQAGMQAHSPSVLAQKSGQNWVDGLLLAIKQGRSAVQSEAAGLFSTMTGITAADAQSPALRGLLRDDSQTLKVMGQASGPVGGVTAGNVINISFDISGVSDAGAVRDLVMADLYGAFGQQDNAGLFGR